nr:hypothetical protein CPAG_05968 [Coccidioides posadasii RMSCC 3488]
MDFRPKVGSSDPSFNCEFRSEFHLRVRIRDKSPKIHYLALCRFLPSYRHRHFRASSKNVKTRRIHLAAMGFAVLPALIPDIPKVYDVYFAAFKADPMGEIMLDILFPGGITEEFRKAHSEGTLGFWHTSQSQYTWKCVDTNTDDIVGMGLADVYLKERTEEERKNPGISWLEGEAKERAENIINPLWEMKEKLWGGRRYIYCHVIGVDPKHQGRKAGAALVRWGIDLSEQTGLPVYFEASPSTVKMYEKMGFETLKETIVHRAEDLGIKEDITVPLMVRMPSCAGGQTFEEWRAKGYPAWSG